MTSPSPGHFTGDGLPVLIGSLPLDSHREALDWIFEATPEIPLWPQLPSNPMEQMMPQFAEGIPCIHETDPGSSAGRIFFDTSSPEFEGEMLAFYEEYLRVSEDMDKLADSRFATSRERAGGLYLFVDSLTRRHDLAAVKGQVTGPFTMLTGIKDTAGRAGYFDDTIREMTLKGIAMKAAWQTRFLSSASRQVIMFIDEPALAGLGSSAFIGVSADEIKAMINEVADGVHRAGGLAGIHVCANTDWSLLLSSEIDVLSFDAYDYFDRIAPLRSELHAFLDRGGIIAWGGVPTSREESIRAESVDSLAALWEQQMKSIEDAGHPKKDLLRASVITPSCGTGSLSPEAARRVLELTRGVSLRLREKYL
ncbi:MAG: hypothetical protein Kow0089_22630 [Desulfobulbaceae bacterium]